MTYFSKLRFLFPAIAFMFSAVAGIAVAAWLDAPNAPPNYGIVGCTPPCSQGDFMPMNLGTTEQTKHAGAIFEGGATASHFVDGNSPYFTDPTLPLYQLDLASSGEAGLIKGRIGIGATSTLAQLTINNPATYGKTGSMSDAIYAYTDNTVYGTSAALSLEQGSPTGYAIYASGGINFFGGDVRVGSATSPKNLCINDDCKSSWPSVSGGITNYLTKWISPTALGNSQIFDNGTNVGIGTASPGAKLDIAGNVQLSTPGSSFYTTTYANLGEDTYGTYANADGMSRIDTCNGNDSSTYTCGVSENKTCDDVMYTGGQCPSGGNPFNDRCQAVVTCTTNTQQINVAPQGMWCGMSMPCQDGLKATCLGYDPAVSCPAGYTRTVMDIDACVGANTWVCIRN